jgi:hypothetical protein
MWPDLASVQLFGLGSITRRLNEQDSRQNSLEAAQQRLENRIETSVAVQANPTINNFPFDPRLARHLEGLVEAQRSGQPGDAAPSLPAEQDVGTGGDSVRIFEEFDRQVQPLKPWLEVARRLRDPHFAAAVTRGADHGTPADDPQLLPEDAILLRRVQRPGHPLDDDSLRRWAAENQLQLDAVRDTIHAGRDAHPESVRIAIKFAELLFADLQRRGLVATS